ncbi:MAG: histidinol-phosphatase [Campylobacterota bacterium]|nr:histidinol-phosphatase [Campylobacterota bacterium]
MRIDLHNHTTLCNHATDTPQEYIEKAIELGIDIYGFSEHAPMKNFEDGYRLTIDKKEFYENQTLELKEKYKDKIDILLGYEVDFIEGDYILDTIKDAKVDYLIGSVHYLNGWGFDNPEFIKEYETRDIDTIWQEYFDAVELMAKSGYFNIVGHLDLIKVFKFLPKKDIKSLALNSLKAIRKSGMAIEINCAGFRKPIGEQYPSISLLELAYELNIPITFSSDAHSVEQVGFRYEDAVNLAKSVGYKKCVYFKNKEMILVDF